MDIFDLYAKISLDISGYKKSVNEVTTSAKKLDGDFSATSDNAQKMTKSLESGFKKVGQVVTSVVTIAGTALVALGKVGVEYNAQMESYTTSFEVMLGSAEDAQNMVKKLQDMASATPFELSDLASATQQLLAYGVASDDTTTYLQELGDISLGSTDKLDSLTRAFGKMTSTGKVTMEYINIMAEQGFNPLQEISRTTGESMTSLYDRVSAGTVTLDEITNSFKTATSEGGQFKDGMEKASKTTEGLVSTLKDVVKTKLGEAFQGVSDKIKEILPKVIEFVEGVDIEGIVNGVVKGFQDFTEWLQKALPYIISVGSAILSMVGYFKLMAIIKSVTEAFTLFNGVLMANPIVLVISAIAMLIGYLVTLYLTNEDFRLKVQAIWQSITQFFVDAWNTIKSVWDTVAGFFQGVWDGIQTAFATVGQFFTDAFTNAYNAIMSVWGGIKGFFSGIWDDITGVFANAWNWFSDIGSNIVAGLKSGIRNAWNGLTNWFNEKWNNLVGGVKGFLGIHSPSTVFAGIGSNMAKGVEVGWDKSYPDIKSTIDAGLNYSGTKVTNGAISINVYGAQGQSENDLAEIVMQKIEKAKERRGAIYA